MFKVQTVWVASILWGWVGSMKTRSLVNGKVVGSNCTNYSNVYTFMLRRFNFAGLNDFNKIETVNIFSFNLYF